MWGGGGKVSHYLTKLYDLKFRFWFLPQFLLRGLTLAVLNVWTQIYLQNVGTGPGRPVQLLTRNNFFQSKKPEPPPPPPPLKCGKFSQKVRCRAFLKLLNVRRVCGKFGEWCVSSAANVCEMCGKSAANLYANKLTS